jgi:light-regulated signal transduction histidine kinase (bacteriophytochrome)
MIGTAQDVTERREMEEKLEIMHSELAAHASELEAANIELEAFNYMVAHDLRTPLSSINGFCQVIQKFLVGQNEDCKKYLREIFEASLRMDRLIGALLVFSSVTRVKIHNEKVALGRIAMELAMGLKMSEPERRVTFRIAEGIVANGDASLLRIVMDNLIGNAWKYSGKREEAVIEFGVSESEREQTFFVRDNGGGFDNAYAEKLFAPFQRLPGSNEFKGHGIGLATVERIVRRHGGRVWAEGEPGKGATFYFTLSAVKIQAELGL